MSKYVDELLREWARWCERQDNIGLGFPRKVPYAEERVDRSVESFVPDVDPEVLRINEILSQVPCPLPKQHRAVIWIHYREPGKTKDKASALGMRRDRYYQFLEHAQAMLESLLESKRARVASV